MRRQLAIRSLAVSSLLVIAFVVPLCGLVRSTAQDRADDQARSDVAALIPVVAISDDPNVIAAAATTTVTGQDERLTIATAQRVLLGSEMSRNVQQALADARSTTFEDGGDVEIVRVVLTTGGSMTAIAAVVPSAQRNVGVVRAWTMLGGAGLVMILIGVLATDRLGRSIVRDIEALSRAAERLGDGDLSVRVSPATTGELHKLGSTFNLLGAQVEDMIDRERSTLAVMSHRLRTPLTRLRLRVDQVADPDLAAELRLDLDDTASELTQMIDETRRSIDERSEPGQSDVSQLVGERLEFWAVLAREQGREFSTALPNSPLEVVLRPSTLVEIVDILLDNVFSHSPEGADLSVRLAPISETEVGLTVENQLGVGASSPGSRMGHRIITERLEASGGRFEAIQSDTMYTATVTLKRS